MTFNELKAAVEGSHAGSVRVISAHIGCDSDAGEARRMGGDGEIGIEWDSQPGYLHGADDLDGIRFAEDATRGTGHDGAGIAGQGALVD